MSIIQIQTLSYTYPGSFTPVFTGLDFTMDSTWRLGLVGRNGRGKTTLIRLLLGELSGTGQILSSVSFDRFPYACDPAKSALSVMRGAIGPYDRWETEMERLLSDGSESALARWGEIEAEYSRADGYTINELIEKEAAKLALYPGALSRPFSSFSPGEQTRLQLASLFLRKDNFLLIDEPTNHLDMPGREAAAEYLRGKQGFLLVSHDRAFLDACVDHIAALEKTGMRIEQGNYSSYRENKRRRDAFEIEKNERIEGEIRRLKQTAREKAVWSDKVEATKIGGGPTDRGRIGHLAAKAMKRSLTIRTRIDREIEEKEELLKDIEYASDLHLNPLPAQGRYLMRLVNACAGYGEKTVLSGLSMDICPGDRIAVIGPNGAGKSTLIKLLLGELPPRSGSVSRHGELRISYMPQMPQMPDKSPMQIAEEEELPMEFFLMLLRKLDLPREAFTRSVRSFSLGQQKKVLLAASMTQRAHLYIWDEPLNYMDVESREQIEQMVLRSGAAMLTVEHDKAFVERTASKIIRLPHLR